MQTNEPYLLMIETATEVCSVALAQGNRLIDCVETTDGFSHAKNLLPAIQKMVQTAEIQPAQLNAVALSIGPGSYTGLRIGASTAKGLAYSLQIPVVAIGTLEAVYQGALSAFQQPADVPSSSLFFAPMIDARRMEVYMTLFSSDGQPVTPVTSEVVDDAFLDSLLKDKTVVFCGNGAKKCRSLFARHDNALYVEASLSAKNLLMPALKKIENRQFEDVAYFEPFYLKEYIAAKPVVKGLR